jgi:transcriptional regulator with XRE-family HTH domain
MSSGPQVEIGRHRASLRVRAGLRQAELAERARVGISTVTRAEAGLPLNETNIRAIATALGIPAGEYFEPQGFGVPVPAHG